MSMGTSKSLSSRLILTAIVAAATIGNLCRAEDWPVFNHDNQRTGVSGTALKMPLGRKWEYVPVQKCRPAWPEPGKQYNRMDFDWGFQTVIAHGMVFFGSSGDHQVHALDLATGKEQWSFFAGAPVRFAPAIVGKRLYFAADDGVVYCLSAATGKLIWKMRGGLRDERLSGNEQIVSRWLCRSGVLVQDGVVYAGFGMWTSDHVFFYALEAETGDVIWKNSTGGLKYMPMPHMESFGINGLSPQGYLCIDDQTLVVPQGRSVPAGIDIRTGKILYNRNTYAKTHHPGGTRVKIFEHMFFSGQRGPTAMRHVVTEEIDIDGRFGVMAWDVATGKDRFGVWGAGYQFLDMDGMYLMAAGKSIWGIDKEFFFEKAGDYVSDNYQRNGNKEYWNRVGPMAAFNAQRITASDIEKQKWMKWRKVFERSYCFIGVGNVLIAGGSRNIVALDAKSGDELWRTHMTEKVRGLSASAGCLVVSLESGRIVCFSEDRTGKAVVNKATLKVRRASTAVKSRAEKILRSSARKRGFVLNLGAGRSDLDLAMELVSAGDFRVVCVEPDASVVTAGRAYLSQCGCYGFDVSVHHGDIGTIHYGAYLFNVLIGGERFKQALGNAKAEECYRILQPYGGTAWFDGSVVATEKLKARLVKGSVPAGEIRISEGDLLICRGELPGAGQWTHHYGGVGRTNSSEERNVRVPLKMLWWGRPGPMKMCDRHWTPPAPLFANGICYKQGEYWVMALDAYNGTLLWERNFPELKRRGFRFRGQNLAVDDSYAYLLLGTECVKLDGCTGKTVGKYKVPFSAAELRQMEREFPWIIAGTSGKSVTARKAQASGKLFYNDPLESGSQNVIVIPNEPVWETAFVTDGLIVGAVAVPNSFQQHQVMSFPEAKYIFALDKNSGETKWRYTCEVPIDPLAMAVGSGRLVFLEGFNYAQQARGKHSLIEKRPRIQIKVLDLHTGKLLEKVNSPLDRADLIQCYKNYVLVSSWGMALYEIRGDRLELLWKNDGQWPKGSRLGRGGGGWMPILSGDKIITYPRVFELTTGEEVTRKNPLTGKTEPIYLGFRFGCGIVTGTKDILFTRAGCAGMIDLKNDSGMHYLGNVRAGCNLDMIPAGGIALMPESTSGCDCPYSYSTSIAMISDNRNESYGSISLGAGLLGESLYQTGAKARIERVTDARINLGSVGDKRDAQGRAWLVFPRAHRWDEAIFLPMMVAGDGAEHFRINADEIVIENTDMPWVYSSCTKNIEHLELDLEYGRPVVSLATDEAPKIDGELKDRCWDGSERILLNDSEQIVDPRVGAWLRHDDKCIYVGYERDAPRKDGEIVPWKTDGKHEIRFTDLNRPYFDDSFSVRFWAGSYQKGKGLWLHCSASGQIWATSATGPRELTEFDIPRLRSAVHLTAKLFSTELAVPFRVLEESIGFDKNSPFNKFRIESLNKSGVGPEKSFHRYVLPNRRATALSFGMFNNLALGRPKRTGKRGVTVTLHFAELENAAAGERMFDIHIGGEVVEHGLDIVRTTGGKHCALIRQYKAEADDKLIIDFIRRKGSLGAVLCGLEVNE